MLNIGKFISLKTGLTILSLLMITESQSANTLLSELCATSPTEWTFNNNTSTNPIQKEGYWLLDAGTPGDQIISPIIDTGNYTNLTLSFNYASFDNGTYNPITVSYSTDGGTTWSTNASTTPTSNSPYASSGDLILGTANSRNFKFRLSNGGTSGRGIKIKDILLTGSPIISPPTAVEATKQSSNSFEASWNTIQGATGYILNVHKAIPVIEENFKTIASTSTFVTSGGGASGNLNLGTSGWNATNGYSADGTIRLGTSSLLGTLISPLLNLSGKFKISFKAAAWTGDSKTIDVTLNGNTLTTISLDNNISSASELKEFSIQGYGSGNDVIGFTAQKASSNRFFIDDVKIYRLEAIDGSPFTISSGTTSSYPINNLMSSTYLYTVQATNNLYKSNESNEISVTIQSSLGLLTEKTNNTSFTQSNSTLFINNANPNERIYIYNISGEVIRQFYPEPTTQITLPTGIYLVKSPGMYQKIVIR